MLQPVIITSPEIVVCQLRVLFCNISAFVRINVDIIVLRWLVHQM